MSLSTKQINSFENNPLKLDSRFNFRPTKDPILRRQEEKEAEPLDPNVPAEDLVKQAVCQYADMPYEEQLALKMSEIEKLMAYLRKEFLQQVKLIMSIAYITAL